MTWRGIFSQRRIASSLALSGAFFLAFAYAAPDADAALIKRVQRGTALFDNQDVQQSVSLPYAVDQTKSIILLKANTQATNADQNYFFTGQFADDQTISIDRAGGTIASSVVWQIVEFEEGVTVQTGVTTMQPTGAARLVKSISIAAVGANAVPIVQVRAPFTDGNQTHEMHLLPTFTNSTTLKLQRYDATGTKGISINWQVIDFLTDVTVTAGTTLIPASSDADDAADIDVDLAGPAANPILFTYFAGNYNVNGEDDSEMTTAEYVTGSPNVLRFKRYDNNNSVGNDVYVAYYLVDFTDDATLYQAGNTAAGSISWASGSSNQLTIASAGTRTIDTQGNGGVQDTTPITIQTTVNHGFVAGDYVTISGAASTALTINATDGTGVANTTPVRIQTTANHGLSTGDRILITGTTMDAFTVHGTYGTGIQDPATADIPIRIRTTANHSFATGQKVNFTGTIQWQAGSRTIATKANGGISNTTPIRIKTTVAHGYKSDESHKPMIVITGAGLVAINGVWRIDVIDTDEFDLIGSTAAGESGGGTINPTISPSITINNTSGVSNTTPIVITTSTVHGLTAGDTINISGSSISAINTSWTVTPITTTTFSLDGSTASGTAATGGTFTRNWVITTIDADEFYLDGSGGQGAGRGNTGTVTSLINGNYVITTGGALGANQFTLDGTFASGTGSGGSATPFVASGYVNNGWVIAATPTLNTFTLQGSTKVGPGGGGTVTGSTISGINKRANGETIRINTTASHGLATGDIVSLSGTGDLSLEGNWPIINNTATSFFLAGSDSVNLSANSGSGTIQKPQTGSALTAIVPSRTIDLLTTRSQMVAPSTTYRVGDDMALAGWLKTDITNPNATTTQYQTLRGVNATTMSLKSNYMVTELSPLKITSPNGSESWAVGSIQNITWLNSADTASHNWKVQMSVNGGAYSDLSTGCTGPSYTSACSGTGDLSSRSIAWRVPDNIHTNVKLRIIDTTMTGAGTPEVRSRDTSNNQFTIKRSVTLTSPVGAEEWVVGAQQYITWDYTGETSWGNVKLEYSTNNGGAWNDVTGATSLAVNNGSEPSDTPPFSGKGRFLWTVPDAIGSQTKVRITSLTDGAVTSQSTSAFTVKRSITLTQPGMAGGELFTAQTPWDIRWTYTGQTLWGNVGIYYSTDPAHSNWTLFDTVSVGSGGNTTYNSTNIPLGAVGSTVKIKVCSETDPTVCSQSSNDFTVTAKITVNDIVAPYLKVDDSQLIEWAISGGGIATVKIEFWNGSQWVVPAIVDSTNATNVDSSHGSYNWTVPNSIGVGRKVRVSNTAIGSVNDETAPFEIKGQITNLYPSLAGVVLNYGATTTITWAPHGTLGNVDIVLSTDGVTFPRPANTIGTVDGNDPGFDWSMGTTAIGSSYKIRVVSTADSAVYVDSANNFSIKGTLSISSPTGGDVWIANETNRNITWVKNPGTLGNVNIEYSTDGGSNWNSLATGQSGTSYNWNPLTSAGLPDSGVTVRVSLASDATVNAVSSPFKVRGKLTVAQPSAAGIIWEVGTSQTITWTSLPLNQGNVELSYSDDGSPFTVIAECATVASANQSCTWNSIPDAISSNVVMRIKSLNAENENTVTDDSDNAFTIRPRYLIVSPNGSEEWKVGEARNITWKHWGTVDKVKLYYSSNGAAGPWNLIASAISDAGAADGSTTASFDWSTVGGVADTLGTTNRIKVESNYDATAADLSDGNFTVRGNLSLAALPAIIRVGASQLISFTKTGSMNGINPNFKILYATDGTTFTDPDNVIATVSGTNTTWNPIPDAARSDTAKIKVQWEEDPTNVNSISGVVAIKPSVTINQPTGGTYNIGDALPIQFTHTGRSSDTFRFRYSINGGSTWTTIDTATGIAPNSPYTHATWNVPNDSGIVAGSGQFKIRVEMVGDESNVTADSAGVTIRGNLGTVSLSSGGSGWTAADTTRQISWTRQGITEVKLEYTLDNGLDNYANTLATGLTADSYTWSAGIPGSAVSDQVKFRVTAQDANDSVTSATSAMITIKPQLILVQPNGPTTRNVGSPLTIQWTSSGAGNIKVEYTMNADAGSPTWQTLAGYGSIDSTPQSDNSATVPDAVSSHVKFRLSNVTANPNLQVSSTSNTEFTVQTALTLDALTGPYILGDTVNVTWTPSGSVGDVTVEYYNGASWNVMTTTAPQNGPYSLVLDTVNSITNATNLARVRVSATNGLATSSTSAAFIVKPYLAVTSPAGNESWVVDSSNNISWTIKGSNISQVALYYSKNSGSTYANLIIDPLNINFGGGNNMSYSWTVPDDIQATKTMKVKVQTLPISDPWAVEAVSNGLFQIVGALAMKTPDDTTPVQWRVGSTQDIEWTNVHGSIANVKLEYSTNSGTNWSTLQSSVTSGGPGDHAYSWTIPNNFAIAKDTFRIRVSDASNSSVIDASTAASSTLASFAFAHPLSGEVWVAENTHTIEWTTPVAGVPANVKIEYNVGSGWQLLPENDGTPNDGIVSNTGSINWALPTNRTAAAQIRISDPNDSASAVTSSNFKIRGDFAVTSPNSGVESWDIASTHNITWTKKGNVSSVKLQFSNNGGSTWSALVDGNSADTQNIDVTGAGPYSFSWKIPDIAGQTTTQALIRVVDASDSTVYDSSDNNFTIKGNVTLTTPNGGETLGVGNVYNVSGTVNGIGITSVRVYYSTNGGGTYPYGLNEVSGGQIVPVAAGAFSQNWSVPDRIGSNLKVRVEDSTNSLVNDESDTAFSIKGTVTLTSPTALSVWSAGSSQNIVWDRNGNVGNVDLYYQINNGTWNSIATSVSSPSATGNTYAWTLPTSSIVSTNVKVKIDGANLLTPEISPAFTVKGAISLTYPDASGISFTLGDQMTVTWSQSGSIGNVKVEYYDGSSWSTITSTAPESGPYQFTLDDPNTTVATAGGKIRVSQASDATVTDTSANDFMVKPLIQITSPAGNEAWVVDSIHNITWTKVGSNVANVKIEYSKDSGTNFNDVIVASTSNDGTHPWTIPDDIRATKDMKVRISTLPGSDLYAVTAVSGGLFQIIGELEMKVPDDTTPIAWRVGSTNNTITWTNVHGSIANVKLEYSTNAGGLWSTLSATEPSGGPGDHSYSWNVPNNFTIVKDNFRIRVSDAANSAVMDASTAASSILASFGFSHPTSGEVWVAENTHTIEWTTPVAGVPSNVKIEYNVGSGWNPIPETDGTANDGVVTNSGSANWTLPVNRTPSAQLRISDANDSASASLSNNFKIRGDLTVTSPNTGGESWEIATNHNITWTKKGDIGSVKLQWSNNGGSSWSALVDGDSNDTQNISTPGTGPYTFDWKVPDIAGMSTTQGLIRVIDTSDATVLDDSDNNFTVKGRVTVSTPNGGETLGVGNTYAVTGTVFGQGITSVRLLYSTNGGTTYPYGLNEVAGGQVVSVSAGSFSQNWSVPDRLGSNLKVRVEDSTNSLVNDESNTAFSIKGTVALTSPTALSVWAAGSQQSIVWDRNGTVGNVDLFYQVNNGTWNTIATSVASPSVSGNSYSWTLPTSGVVSTNVKVKIDGANLLTPEISPAFTVKGAIALTYPDAANIVLTLGDPLNITWSQTGSIGDVKVEYFDGTSWSTLTTTAPESGPYSFTLDGPTTTVATANAKVRVSQANDATVTDTSANDFMVKPFVQITSPAGNEAWVVGTSHNVTWNYKGSNVSNVKIEYSKDSGSNYNDVIDASTANDGSFAWTIPDDIRPTKDMKVRISTLPGSDLYAVQAVSTGLFQIVGALEMVVPDDTTPIQWRIGTTGNEIKWNATGSISQVKIEYSNNSGSTWSTLEALAPSGAGANKSFSWDIPDSQTIVKDNFRIRVLDAANTNVYDVADAASSILADFTITHPVSGEVWVAESAYDIEWSTPVPGTPATVKLEYNVGGGWQTIDAAAPNSGLYNWTLPAGLSTAARVRISDPDDASSAVVSDPFKIRGELTLTSPVGGESLTYNTHHNVTWTKKGNIPTVKLEYTTNGTLYTLISTGINPATGTPFDWTVPDVMSQTVKVKVTDTSDSTVYSQSGTNFTIKGTLTVTAPNGSENWVVGTVENVTWSKTGSIADVKIDYSTNGGGTYPGSIIASTGAAAGTYGWTIPDAIGSQVRVRVMDVANNAVLDTSDNNFSIKGALTVTAPNGNEILSVGSNTNITWTRSGSIANVKIEFSTDGGATYPNLITNVTDATSGTYPWTVPDALGLTTKVKISDASDLAVFDVSNANFTIRGALTLTAPNGNEVWKVGQQQDIVWQRFGSITAVKLEYSTNGGSTYPNTIIGSTSAAAGTYPWTIPDSITIQARVRVTDVNDNAVFDASDVNFAIKGTITVTAPNGGEAWGVGTNQNITWTRQGSIANVKIEYSTDGGTTYPVEIIDSTDASTGLYTWTIPDDLTILGRVKVTNVSDGTVFDASNANFKIIGALFLTAPDTGEGWAIGTNQNITWTRTGSIQDVKIELSTNGGSTFPIQVTASTPAGGLSYNWLIPDIPTTTARIRISDANDATVNDVSAVNFKIQGTFAVTSPNDGTEVWDVNSSHNITWTKVGSVATVRIEYSTDGGANYGNVVNAQTGNNGSYSWTIPDAISSGVRVRISDFNDYTAFDTSDLNFTIRGVLTLTAPNGGEDWDVASHHDVTWTRVGSISAVKLEYSTNGGSTYPGLIIASVDASLGTYDWTIPDVLSTTMKVKITDTSNASVSDESNLNFTIKGALTVNAPNGGEQWTVNSGRTITWTRFGAIATVRIDYSTDGGTTYPNNITMTADASLLSFGWTVPDDISTTVKVRVMDISNSNVFDASNANFAIRGSFAIVAPNGGETWIVGESRNITWTRQGSIPNAKLEYSTDGGGTYPNVIIGVQDASTGTYGWTVPDAIDTDIRVKISDVNNAAVFDESNADFIIKGSLSLTAPNGGETWIVGAANNITWNRSGTISFVKLEYSTNGGSTYPNTIIASTNGLTGTYPWTVADAISTQVRVRVSDVSDPSVIDASDANFTVKGSITVTAPNGGEAWVVGTSQAVTWTKTGTLSTVAIDYSTNGGSTYPNSIAASVTASAGTHSWTIPDDIQSAVRVKITNNADTSVSDASDTNFKITGAFTLTAPNGGEQWKVGQNNNITWTKVGSIGFAKLEYSTNGGSTYPNTINPSTPAGALSYTWNVPDSLSIQARVRISDASDATVLDTSNANFEIQASFAITAPNGGEVWVVASAQDITWNKVGSATNVKIDYSTNGGTTYPNSISANTNNSGTFTWTIPDSISSSVKVRIADLTNDAAFDVSDANFKIRGSVTITAPNGSESWNVASLQDITWTKVGSISTVKLEYSTDSGSTYPNLINANVAATDLTYSWTVPDAISANVKVKVTDASDSTVFDESNSTFRIRGTFTLTHPNGAEVLDVGSAYTIRWTKVGSIADAKLEYSTDGGGTYPNVIVGSIDPATLQFDWTIPDSISTLVRVRIVDNNDSIVKDNSDANLKIRGVLSLTAPNGSEVWNVASVHNITWTRLGSVSTAKLEYSTNSGSTYPNMIIGSIGANLLTYAWTVPDSISTQVRVRITNLADATVTDASDADFKIAGVLTLTSPNGGEIWSVGSSQPISWTRIGSIAEAKLEYSADGGVNYGNVIVATTPAANLSYGWTVPDVISATMRVRISNVADATVFDDSDANFKVRGAFTLTSPNGNEAFVIGSSRNVTWTRFGSIANAKLEYSTNGGTTYPNVIIGSIDASLLTYSWPVPDNASTQVRVRISQVGDATVFDDSDANFVIRAGFTVTSPTGGEAWAVGSSHDITWVTGGTIPNVKLEYSANGGNSYTTIIGTTTNNQTYPWVVPDAITTQARVRVSDVNDAQAADISPANFKIHGTFTLTAPNGAEQWLVGSSRSITWTKSGSIASAKLEYSTDGGSTYPNLIQGSVSASALTYSWTIPDRIGTTLKVKITDLSDSSVNDVSDNVFTIKAAFTITAPNGGENWVVGSAQNIVWGTLGTVATVKLEYATDGGTAYNTIIASVNNTGSYNWTIPDAITTQARVRISDTSDSTATDASDNNFKIRGSLTITAPNGGEKWNVGTNRIITWDRTGSIPTVKLEYSSNNGTVYAPINLSANNTGSYSWTVPDAITTQGLIRITDTADNTVTDVSNASFKIMGNFTVTSPNGGEVWTITSARDITWTSSGTMNFAKIDYSTDGGATFPNQIIGSTTNNGLFSWTVPDGVSGQVRIRVSDPNDADAYDDSNANFRIRMTFTLTAPNGGQKWPVASSRNITWTSVGTITNAKLQFSRDGFLGDIVTINNGVPNNGSYSWTIPDAISSTVRIRVSDPNDIGAYDDSNADFKILGGFTVTSPNGGEKWDVGTTQTLTWTPTGTVPDARLEYSTDGGATYPYTIAATPNTGSYDWLIPDTITAALKIRVSDLNDAEAFDVTDVNAKIRAKFTLTAPNGGQIWTVGDSNNIAWTTIGTVPNVKLDYSTDSGATFPGSIQASVSNAGSYAWTIPDAISTNVRVRVMSATDVDAFDSSDANLKIRGKFTITAPNGGEQWKIAQSNNITWTTTGTIADVKITYSTNGGSTFPTTIAASVANTNTYAWTIPDTPTAQARIHVENIADATVYDESDANFSIQGFFTLTAPNGGEAWAVASAQSITWSWGGTIPQVKLTYSTDGGSTYPNVIQASTANGAGSGGNHSYSWTVPDTISPTVRVKVEDPNDDTVFDVSNANLKIVGHFTITAPNGGERWVTYESRNITWTTDGTIPVVKIEYSYDDFVTPVVIDATASNTGSYAWTLPDPGIANIPKASKVRITDVNDSTVSDVSDASFNIDYYYISWEIRDLLTNASLSALSVVEVKSSDPEFIQWSEAGIATNPPRVQPTPYGTWVATWSKTGYGEVAQVVIANQDQNILMYMETSAVHIWLADSRVSFDADADTMDIVAWLSRDGSITTGGISAAYKIYDGATLLYTLTDNTIDAAGFFNFSIPSPTGFVAGKTYTAICEVAVGSGGVFKTPTSFEVSTPKTLEQVKDTINANIDKPLSQINLELQQALGAQTLVIQQKLDDQSVTITTKLDQQTSIIQQKLDDFENTIQSSITALESAAQLSLDSAQALEDTALKFSWKAVVAPNPALSGDEILLQSQGPAGLHPYLSIYNHKNKQVIANGLMEEDLTRPGNYSFKFPASAGDFQAGEAYTYIVTEDITGGLVAGSGFVEAISLTSVAGLASAAPAAEKAAKEAVEAIRELESTMAKGGDIRSALKSLQKSVADMPAEIAKASGGDTKQIRSTVNEISEKIQQLAGKEGLDLGEMIGQAIDESATVQEIQARSGRIQQGLEMLGAVVQKRLGGADEPIVATFLEAGA